MEQKIRVIEKVFTKEQLMEQKEFNIARSEGRTNIIFEGTFDEGIKFLDDTAKLVNYITS